MEEINLYAAETCRKKSFAFLPAFFFFNFNQNDIRTDLTYTFPWNDVFRVPPKKRADAGRAGDDQSGDTTGAGVNIHITDTSEGSAGTGVNDFFLTQFTETHGFPVFYYFMRKYAVYALTEKNGFAILQRNEYTQE